MVQVHIWLAHGTNVGHTSLTVKDRYISFWPDTSAGKKDLKLKRSQPGTFVRDLDEDISYEGGFQPMTIRLDNVDAEKIIRFFEALQDSVPRYQITRNNCSHIVAQAIMEGVNRKPSFTPKASSYSKLAHLMPGIWTPDQVLRFVNEVKQV